ncbi:hypothetical protein STCU_11005 [Strigomonas culicis]|uniref:Multidrug resistance protein, MATE family n=1 Tax=Strigomonas culicis TaxID=28005 RepID=S9V1T7_9TRYP|nr:hypothetical protein STCU_11005 [Strigomonas culicis]|eukprot:EPY16775.1 hypothetical protein STCU_11005 [Strigomonas culicis]
MSAFGTTGRTLELAGQVVYLLPFFHTCDAVQFAFQGIFSGLGKNHLGALILLTSLWGIGIPLSVLMGHFLDYRMFGVCAGITVGLCIEAPTMVFVALQINYAKVCEQFIEDEEEEESEEDEEEEDEEHDEEYVEEVMRRSGISTSSQDPHDEYPEHYKKLLPPKKRRRGRRVHYEDDDDEEE